MSPPLSEPTRPPGPSDQIPNSTWRSIVQAISDQVLVFDADLKIIYVNHGGHGFHEAEIIDKLVSELEDGPFRDSLEDALSDALKTSLYVNVLSSIPWNPKATSCWPSRSASPR